MKKFLLFAVVVLAFAACTQDVVVDITPAPIVDEAPETLVVGFEGDDTRIQLNEAQKTVWTNGDLVSVFYKSDANQKYEYRGETGERTAELHKVSAGSSTTKMGYVVVAYPYNEEYIISPATGNLETMLPAVQHYAVDSYGVGDNLMVSCSEFTQFSLKSVCGWLKLQLTGNGEVVKGIKFRGNNGEQVAGLIHVDTKSAEAMLYSEEVAPDDNGNANGSLVIDGAMATEVMLYCDEGVTLSNVATAFYIALPPQTFEEGFTVDVICADGTMMAKSSDKKLSIERNHIQPLSVIEFAATGTTDIPTEPDSPATPNLPTNEKNKIYYTTSDGKKMFPTNSGGATFGAILISNTYKDGVGVMTFDDDVTMIGEEAFSGCSNLTNVSIPNNVTVVGEKAFYNCDSLTSVTIPDSVTEIGNSAFSGCGGKLVINSKIVEYDHDHRSGIIIDGCWIYGSKFSEIIIGSNVEKIGECAFYGCSSLTSVTIPGSVTEIGEWAFSNCSSLTSVTIPDSVTTIGSYAFAYCSSLTEFKGKFAEDNGRVLVIDGTLVAFAPNGLSEYTILDSVTEIGYGAFYYCSSLTSVTIPDSVTEIGSSAFCHCSKLTSVTIPDSVTEIGGWAFEGCDSLTSVIIPDSVTTIGDWAFYSCDSLTSVNIPDSVTTIGNYAFSSCNSLTRVYCYATIPPSLEYNAFSDNASVRRIYVYEECVELYKSAWSSYKDRIYTNGENCPETTTIEYTTNDGNTMTSSKLPIISNSYENGVGTMVIAGKNFPIPNYAFRSCSSLTSVTIPDSVTTIGIYAFYECSSLTSVTIPDSVTTIGDVAFASCSKLTSVTIPDSVTEIGGWAFEGCSSLTSVTIPDSVTTIGNYAFRRCTSLTSVTIGDSVTSIGDDAFYDCTSLTSVYCKATTPPALGGSSVFDYNASGRRIIVPIGSGEAYKTAEYWSEYANDIFEDEF